MDSVVATSPTRSLRIKTIAIIGVTATIVGVLLPTDFINTTFYTILAVLAYLMAPWTAVNLVDYFVVRKGRYSIAEIFNPRGIYGNWNWRGITAYTVAFISMIPFMYLSFYQGPVAIYLGGVDFAFFVGIPAGAILYWLFCLNLDLQQELSTIAASDRDVDMRVLGGERRDKKLQMFVEHYSPGTDTGKVAIKHDGETAACILEGTVELETDEGIRRIEAGGGFQIFGPQPYRLKNVGKTVAVVACAVTPPMI